MGLLDGERPRLNFLTGDKNETRRESFKRQEKKVAKSLGGVATVGSGNKGMKGDAHGGDRDAGQRVMAECKSTEGKGMRVELAWLDKLQREALQASMEPCLVLRFDATSMGAKDWACIPHDRYLELLELEAAVRKNDS